MKKKPLIAVTLVLVVIAAVVMFLKKPHTTDAPKPFKIGWQPPWVNQGQIVEVLKHTDILKQHHVSVDFIPFTYGGPLTEAALAGSLDIFFSGDQPGMTLVSKDSHWKIIARMVNYRSAIIVPRDAPIQSLEALKGKRIAAAFGSTTHRDLIRELRNVGIDPEKEVTLINLDQAEHAAVIAGGGDQWSGVDAIATYDPTVAIGLFKGNAKIVREWLSPAVVVAHESILKERKEDVVNFLRSYREAFSEYGRDPAKYNKLYSAESRLELPDSVYARMAKIEPNMAVTDVHQVDVTIDGARAEMLQHNADLAFTIGVMKNSVQVKECLNDELIIEAGEKEKTSTKEGI